MRVGGGFAYIDREHTGPEYMRAERRSEPDGESAGASRRHDRVAKPGRT